MMTKEINLDDQRRIICWWSAGIASAAAAYLQLLTPPEHGTCVQICYCDTSTTEHPDNIRFLQDCERLYNQNIVKLKHPKYTDTWDVWKTVRYIVGPVGAPCTKALKKDVRRTYQRATDVHIFGFTIEEKSRALSFEERNQEIECEFPLIERGWTKQKCLEWLLGQGIDIPMMYKLGYRNNNCIGCVKGGMGYWNKIRVDFPEVFSRMAKLERDIGASCLKDKNGRIYLDTLDPSRGRYESELDIECGVGCDIPWNTK